MNKFLVSKIAFAIALSALLAGLYPLVKNFDDVGFIFLGYNLKIIYAYSVFLILLLISVYFYALNFIKKGSSILLSSIGNLAYASAISIPIIYVSLYILQLIFKNIAPLLTARFVEMGQVLFSAIGVLIATLSSVSSYFALARRDKLSALSSLKEQKVTELEKAKALLSQENYQEAFFSIVSGLKNSLTEIILLKGAGLGGQNLENIISATTKIIKLSPESTDFLTKIVQLEMEVKNGSNYITKEIAEKFLHRTYVVIAEVDRTNLINKQEFLNQEYSRRATFLITFVLISFALLLFRLYKIMF